MLPPGSRNWKLIYHHFTTQYGNIMVDLIGSSLNKLELCSGHFPMWLSQKGGFLIKDPSVWLDGSRPPP